MVSIQEPDMMACLRQLMWAKLGDEYVMGSRMCGYNVEIAKSNLFDEKRRAFDF